MPITRLSTADGSLKTASRLLAAAAWILLAASGSIAGSQSSQPTPVPAARPDFSGIWELDPKLSLNASPAMNRTVLSVTQKGNRIQIEPVKSGQGPNPRILPVDLVVDGVAHEKALGRVRKGLVTAKWGRDGKSISIEVEAAPPAKRAVVERGLWTISRDRTVWIVESNTVSQKVSRRTRLAFRKRGSS
jgi:hypothetical protein